LGRWRQLRRHVPFSSSRGRLCFVDGYYGTHGEWIEKPNGFKTWGRSLLSTTTKKLSRYEMDYIGHETRAWLESSNGRLAS
jgi:hypothetical protein